jgi:hypothetical protein
VPGWTLGREGIVPLFQEFYLFRDSPESLSLIIIGWPSGGVREIELAREERKV